MPSWHTATAAAPTLIELSILLEHFLPLHRLSILVFIHCLQAAKGGNSQPALVAFNAAAAVVHTHAHIYTPPSLP